MTTKTPKIIGVSSAVGMDPDKDFVIHDIYLLDDGRAIRHNSWSNGDESHVLITAEDLLKETGN